MGLGVYFPPPSSACFTFMQQHWLACWSNRQLSPLISCLAGGDRAGTDGMGVLAGSCPWHKARIGNRCWRGRRQSTMGPVWEMGYRLGSREMESGRGEQRGWVVQGKQPRGEKLKEISSKARFCFRYCCYVSTWICAMLTLWFSIWMFQLTQTSVKFPNEPPSFNCSLSVLMCKGLLSSVQCRAPEYAECTWWVSISALLALSLTINFK